MLHSVKSSLAGLNIFFISRTRLQKIKITSNHFAGESRDQRAFLLAMTHICTQMYLRRFFCVPRSDLCKSCLEEVGPTWAWVWTMVIISVVWPLHQSRRISKKVATLKKMSMKIISRRRRKQKFYLRLQFCLIGSLFVSFFSEVFFCIFRTRHRLIEGSKSLCEIEAWQDWNRSMKKGKDKK